MSKRVTFTYALWVNISKSKLESGHHTFCECYIQGASQKKQYRCFFRGVPKIKKRKIFSALWVNIGKSK